MKKAFIFLALLSCIAPRHTVAQPGNWQWEVTVDVFEGTLQGFFNGAFHDLKACANDTVSAYNDIHAGVGLIYEKTPQSVLSGIKDLGNAMGPLQQGLTDCKAAYGDIQKFVNAFKQLENPETFAFHVGKDLLVNGKDIYQEVMAAVQLWQSQSYLDCGVKIGEALNKLLIGFDAQTSTLGSPSLEGSTREELEAAFMKKWGHIVTIAEVKPLDEEFPPEPPSCIAELKKVCGQCFKGASPDMGCLEKCGPMHIPELVKAGCKKPAEAPQPEPQPGRSLLQANPFAGLTNAISSITGAWSSIVSAFKSSYSQQLEYEQLGRGWSKFKESTKVFKGAGLEYAKAPEFFKDIRTMIAIPPKYNSQFDQILQWIQFFDSEYWSEHDTTWSIGQTGTNTHFTMFANNNQNTSKIDVVFLTIAEEFKLAPDIFVISQSHSSFGGLFSSTTLKFKKKPGAMTDEELTFVSQFFMLQAYQEIALAMNLPQPGGGADPVGPPPPPALESPLAAFPSWVKSSLDDGTCAKPGHCGRAYQACCAGFAAKGYPCTCHLVDGTGKTGNCGTCGTAYSACCAAYGAKGFPCTCDIQ